MNGFTGVSPSALAAWKRLNSAWGKPLSVVSAYRDAAKNAEVGGARKSQHIHGNAFDVSGAGMSEQDKIALIGQARKSGFGGVGVYNNNLHFDVGKERAWGPDYSNKSIPAWARGAVGMPGTYAPHPTSVSATPVGKALNTLAVGESTIPTPAQSPFGAPEIPLQAQQTAQAAPMQDKKIFGLSTTPPDPNSRAMAIAKAIGAFGTGLAAGNPAAGLQGAADVASDFTQGRANIQQAQTMGLTPQQMGVLGSLPPEQQSAILAQQAFAKPAGPTELQRNLELLPESDRQKAMRVEFGLEPKATDMAATAPASYQEFRLAQQDPVAPFKGSFTEWKKSGGGGADYAKQPQYGVDKDGNVVILQLGSDGQAVQTKLPEGVSLSKEPIKMDAGTHFVLIDPVTRQNVGTIPKGNYKAEFDKAQGGAEGKAKGEATASFESMSSKMPGLKAVVADLDKVAEKATYTSLGQARDFVNRELGREPGEGALARTEYIAKVDNQILPLLRDTFGAAFTVKEGETLRATLGDPNKSPKEKQIVLKAFIEQKMRDVEALRSQSNGGSNDVIPQGVDPADWEFMSPEDRALFR
jgi:hypothetical protein